jgi:DNA-binding Xre family transcriptional regulator
MAIGVAKKEIDIDRLRAIFEDNPRKKREVQDALEIDRQTMSKILSRIRGISAGELLTIATVLNVDPMELGR